MVRMTLHVRGWRAIVDGCVELQKEYETILRERNAVSSLNQLDALTKEAEERKGKAPPGENPISYAPPEFLKASRC